MLPALRIRQEHVAPSRRAEWSGVSAELLTTSDLRAYDFVFDGPALYLCFGLSGRREDSVVTVDGERPTRFVEIANRFHVVPAGARFEGFSVPATPQRLVQVYLDTRAGALHPDIDLGEIAPRLAALDAPLVATARKFEAALSAPDAAPLGRLYGETLGCALAVEILRWQRGNRDFARPVRGGLSAPQLRRVTAFIEGHLADEIGLVQLADLVGLSPWHFCRAFKRSTGVPPHRFLVQSRVERAKRLLADRGASVTEVALALGFGGSTQFARAFRAAVGSSPREYRDRLE
jgi:AraC family transcriptional regulator